MVPQKLRIEFSYDAAVLSLGIYLNNLKTFIYKVMCTPVVIAALFTVVSQYKEKTKVPFERRLNKDGMVHK